MSQQRFVDPDPLFSTNGLVESVEYNETEREILECKEIGTQAASKIVKKSTFHQMHQITTNIIVGTFLEQMCFLYAKDKTQADELFKKVCHKLMPVTTIQHIYSDHYKRLREQYRQSLIGLIHTTWYEMFDKSRNIPALDASGAVEALVPQRAGMEPVIISKYLTEFKEMEKISTGGFGSVYVARNIFEQRDYAVKKIPMPLHFESENVFHERIKEIKKEVDFLSSLNHPNIVRYYSSWLEHPSPTYDIPVEQAIEQLAIDQSSSLTNYRSYTGSGTRVRIKTLSGSNTDESLSQGSPRKLDESGTSSVVHFEDDEAGDGGWNSSECHVSQSLSKSEASTSVIWEENEELESQISDKFLKETLGQDILHISQIILYIQMHLCKSTLHKWLQNRPPINLETASEQEKSEFYHKNINIFKQLLSALAYIHQKKIIHRDISTKNLFLDDDTLLLGDFGLSAKYTDRDSEESFSTRHGGGVGDHSSELTKGLGTPLYSAPEQRTSSNYNYKVDIYSAGVILLEIFWPMETLHEKSETAKMARALGEFPKLLMKHFPLICQVIAKMLSEDPKARPSADDLLKNNIFHIDRYSGLLFDGEVSGHGLKSYMKLISELKAENTRLEAENTRLKAENTRLEAENIRLKADNNSSKLSAQSGIV